MILYLINILISMMLANAIVRCGESDRKRICLVTMLVIQWTLIYGLRFHVGSDSWSFYDNFQRYLVHGRQTLGEFLSGQRDFLFSLLEYGCYKVFHGRWIPFSIVLGLFSYIPYIVLIVRESTDIRMSTLLFIFCMNFYSGFNTTRQMISVGFSLLAFYRFFRCGKYVKYALLMFLAFGFHSAAMFVIPIHILSNHEFARKRTFLRLCFILGILLFLKPLWAYVIRGLMLLGQDKMAYDYAVLSETKLNILRFLVYAAPAIAGILLYPKIREEYEDVDGELLMVCYGAVFAAAGMTNVVLTRVSSYMSACEILFIPKLTAGCSLYNRGIMRFVILLLYFVYMVVLLLSGEGHYYPYHTVFEFNVR